MGTRQRILDTALTLFNDEGEAQVSMVDVANVLEISPGNLYYHFKGKDPLIQRLFDDFEEEMGVILRSPEEKQFQIEENWVYFYIILEEIYSFRFFYHDLPALLERYPSLARRFRTLMGKKTKVFALILSALTEQRFMTLAESQRKGLAERMMAQITFWPAYQRIAEPDQPLVPAIHKGVHTLMAQLLPYVRAGQAAFEAFLDDFYAQKIGR